MRILAETRSKYKKKYEHTPVCVFCSQAIIRDQGAPDLHGKHWIVLANKYPYLDGNLMVIPKRHVTKLEDVHESEWKEFPLVLHAAQSALGQLFKTHSFNVGINLGPDSGASIPHLHWVIVPRTNANRNVNALKLFGEFTIVTMGYKTLLKQLAGLKKKKPRS